MVRRGRRFESVRGLYQSAANRRFLFREDLHDLQRAVGMEPFMEPPGSEGAPKSAKNARLLLRGGCPEQAVVPF